MNTITINKEEYISSDVLFEKAPVYCKLSRSARSLIIKKEIKKTDYIFAKLIDKKWTSSDGKSYKFDKVFFKKTFVNNIPEINEDKVIIDDNNVQLAPNIIHLEDSEKFKDENNNVIEIETRGERKVDSIYFKVKDVMVGFKIENILTTIIDKRSTGYKENEHYKYFNIKKVRKKENKTNKIKKELYLTYKGFQRAIFLSRNNCTSNNLYTIKKWLDNFDKKVLNNYKVNIKDNIIQNKIGYIYIVSSNLLDAVKIGMWRSSIEALYSRYITCYGKNIHIDYFLTSNARELENKTHKYFKNYQITNELFDKIYYNKYLEFIETNIDKVNEQLINNDSDNLSIITDNILTTTEIYNTNYIEMQQKILSLEKQVTMLTNLLSN